MTPTARTPKATTRTAEVESPSQAASRYQQLRSHLAANSSPPPKHYRPSWTRPALKACR